MCTPSVKRHTPVSELMHSHAPSYALTSQHAALIRGLLQGTRGTKCLTSSHEQEHLTAQTSTVPNGSGARHRIQSACGMFSIGWGGGVSL